MVGVAVISLVALTLTFDSDDDETNYDREGWETISMDGQVVGIRTSTIEEKCQAFDTLVIYCNTLGARFGPYLSQSLELALPALLFYFHEGVREAACRCVHVFRWGSLTDSLYLGTCYPSCPYGCAFVIALRRLFPLFLCHTTYMVCA